MRDLIYIFLIILLVFYLIASFMDRAFCGEIMSKIELWDVKNGTKLRGANIYQRRVYPELDGEELLGSGPVGPPYTQEDFLDLASKGANYVNISHPGIFTENPPYQVDNDIVENLDRLLNLIASANMFAVISFRTGPGRSEFTFFYDEVGTWFDESYLNDHVWEDPEAQQAWVDMWRYCANRYKNNHYVIGYDLMVEPNSNDVLLDIWDPEEFYQRYGNTLYDWNQLYPKIVQAIREVDPDTPILIGGMAYSAVSWLPYMKIIDDPKTIYCAHQYEPYDYTHQEPPLNYTYPGFFDIDGDEVPDNFNKSYLIELLQTVGDFMNQHKVNCAINEYGLMRWEPGAESFLDDEMSIFENMGINYALWVWDPKWQPWNEEIDEFNFRHGQNPDNHTNDEPNALTEVIYGYWSRNTIYPDKISFENEKVKVKLELSKNAPDCFKNGDKVILSVYINNSFNVDKSLNTYVILDVYGNYYFAPSWSKEIDFYNFDVKANDSYSLTVLDFTFPEVEEHYNGLYFYSACTFPGTYILASNIDSVEFCF